MIPPPPLLLLAPHLVNTLSVCMQGCVLIVRQSRRSRNQEKKETKKENKEGKTH